jgi:peptidoglycan/LPS O-acetylase OafA/YrhL
MFAAVDQRPEAWRSYFAFEPSILGTLRFALFDTFFAFNPSTALIPPLWTMPIELAGSVLILALCALAGDHPRRWIIYFGSILVATVLGGWYVFFAAFIFGTTAAEIFNSKPLAQKLAPFAPLSIIAGAIAATCLPGRSEYWYLAVSCLLFTGLTFWAPSRVLLELSISRSLGLIAFPLYLVHSLVMWTFEMPILIKFGGLSMDAPLLRLAIGTMTVAISVLLAYYLTFIDRIAIQISRNISKSLCV